MRTYEYNGKLYKFADDKVPAGAVLHSKAKAPVKTEPVKADEPVKDEIKAETKTKAKKTPANKSRKAGANK